MNVFLLKENLRKFWMKYHLHSNDLENELIGKKGKAISAINQDEGKVEFKGTTWPAKSSLPISIGEEVEIIDNDSIVLHVKSVNK